MKKSPNPNKYVKHIRMKQIVPLLYPLQRDNLFQWMSKRKRDRGNFSCNGSRPWCWVWPRRMKNISYTNTLRGKPISHKSWQMQLILSIGWWTQNPIVWKENPHVGMNSQFAIQGQPQAHQQLGLAKNCWIHKANICFHCSHIRCNQHRAGMKQKTSLIFAPHACAAVTSAANKGPDENHTGP